MGETIGSMGDVRKTPDAEISADKIFKQLEGSEPIIEIGQERQKAPKLNNFGELIPDKEEGK